MPDNVPTPTAPPAPPAPSSTPLGTTVGGAPVSVPWRAPSGAPAWAQGKTPEEILGIADAAMSILNERKGTVPPPTAVPEPTTDFGFADEDYITGAQLKQLVERIGAPTRDTAELAASATLGVARQQFAQDFTKYGAEISGMLATVPKNLWTLDNIGKVVKMVRSDHLAEIIAQERANFTSGMEPTLRSSGAAAPAAPVSRENSLESEEIPAEWKRRASAAGVTERVVDEFCRANDMTPAAFYKQFKTPLNRIVEDIPQRREA